MESSDPSPEMQSGFDSGYCLGIRVSREAAEHRAWALAALAGATQDEEELEKAKVIAGKMEGTVKQLEDLLDDNATEEVS